MAGSCHRHAAAGVRRVQQRLQRLAAGISASIGPEGVGGHEAAERRKKSYVSGCDSCRVLPRCFEMSGVKPSRLVTT